MVSYQSLADDLDYRTERTYHWISLSPDICVHCWKINRYRNTLEYVANIRRCWTHILVTKQGAERHGHL